FMKHFALLLIGGLFAAPGCGKQLACGAGTVEMNGQCVVAGTSVTECPDGSVTIGGTCYPLICGRDTRFDPATGTCVGTGTGGSMGCSSNCSAPSASTVCVTGAVRDFIDGTTVIGKTATSHAVVKIYDP